MEIPLLPQAAEAAVTVVEEVAVAVLLPPLQPAVHLTSTVEVAAASGPQYDGSQLHKAGLRIIVFAFGNMMPTRCGRINDIAFFVVLEPRIMIR